MPRKLTSELVYEEIKKRISEGLWKPGDQIPSVQQLADELEVGISSVREAIRILGKQKVLRVEQGRGTFIEKDLSDLSDNRFDFLGAATMLQLTSARQIIEPELAALAAENASAKEIRDILKDAYLMEEKVKAKEDFLKYDIGFHYKIAKASKNEVLFHMICMISDLLEGSRKKTMKMPGTNEKAAYYHLLIAKAIADRNPTQARILMKSHLDEVLHQLKKEKT